MADPKPGISDIPERDLRVEVFRNGGTRMRLTHLPTGIVLTRENVQSQIHTRILMIQELRERLAKG